LVGHFAVAYLTRLPSRVMMAAGLAPVAVGAVGAYRDRRGPDGPRDHDGAPRGVRASGDRPLDRADPASSANRVGGDRGHGDAIGFGASLSARRDRSQR
jgi:hypothetical protein